MVKPWHAILALALIMACSKAGACTGRAPPNPPTSHPASFIRVQNGVFVTPDCLPFEFSGYNAWEVIEAALGMCCGGPTALTAQFKEAASQNLTVVRIFGFPVQEGFNLQTAPGVYNETAFVGLDKVIAEAGKHGLRLSITLNNNWAYNLQETSTKCAYTNWSTTARDCDDFFTDPQAMSLFKQHIAKVAFRINSITGIPYNLDATIMGWSLINEPRNGHVNAAKELQAWIVTMSTFVKRMAPYQLVTVGDEGFYQPSMCQSDELNPIAGWPVLTGQDFMPNHLVHTIDYASIHLWPDNWGRVDMPYVASFIKAHAAQAKAIGKPCVIEEFGKFVGGIYDRPHTATAAKQHSMFEMVYALVQQSILGGGGMKGILFWRWKARDPTIVLGAPGEEATLGTNSSVFQDIIRPFSARVAALNEKPGRPAVKGCKPLPAGLRVPPVVPHSAAHDPDSASHAGAVVRRHLLPEDVPVGDSAANKAVPTLDDHLELGPEEARLPTKRTQAPPKETLPPYKPTQAPPKATLPPYKPTQAPPAAEETAKAVLRLFKSTFAPQLPGLTPANVNKLVSCPHNKTAAIG